VHLPESVHVLGEHQDAGGLLVEAVNQLQETRVTQAKLFDHADTLAGASVHGNSWRFVNDQEVAILEKKIGLKARIPDFPRGISRTGDSQRRDSNTISTADSGGWAGAPAIDPDLPVADDAVYVALGNPLEFPQEEVIESLACFNVADQVGANLGFSWCVQKIRLGQ